MFSTYETEVAVEFRGADDIELRLSPGTGVPSGVSEDHPVLVRAVDSEHDDCWVLHYMVSGLLLRYVTYGSAIEALEDATAWYTMQ